MKSYLEIMKSLLLACVLALGTAALAGAQDAPPDSQQPEEIPAPNPPQPGSAQQPAQNDAGAARISFIRGDVSTQHSDSSDWAAATLNTPVVTGDHVSTGKQSRTEIQLDHANILRMSEDSTANIQSLSRSQLQVQIGQGLVNYDVLRNNETGAEIDTPNVAIRPQIGPGSYRIQVNSDGETTVDVRRGSAQISTPQGSTIVQHDQRITIQGNADNAQYNVSSPYGKDEWDRWNSDRDHTIESAESWRHTDPYYTGTQDLDAHGHWSNVPDYGDVWFPAADPGWVPYRDGRWVYEPYYGWTWVSYEPWGWAPYHYGRWFVYGGNWGWWPGPVYGGYYPVWAPAYVSFFGFGGGGWGFNFGFGFGSGFANVGWLPCGPGDRFFPWYGRGVNRVNVVNIYNIHNEHGRGFEPLRGRGFSNVDRAFTDEHVRGGISSMRGDQFGRGRVPTHQDRLDAGSLRQANVLTGSHPVGPSRESFRPSDRQANPSSIPDRASMNQRFFSNARQGATVQAQRPQGGFDRGGTPGSVPSQQNNARPGFRSFGPNNSGNVSRGPGVPPSSTSNPSIESSRSGWHTFTPPSRTTPQATEGNFGGRGAGQSRPGFSQPNQSQRPYENNSRGISGNYGNGRPQLNMRQPVVTPRGGGPSYPPSYGGGYSGGRPSGGGYRSAPSGGGNRGGYSGGGSSYPRSAPSYGGGYSGGRPSGGGNQGGYSGGGSRGGNSGGGSSNSGGHSSSGHNGR